VTKQNHRSSNGEPCFEAMRHFEVGRAAIDRCDLDKAIAEFTKAIRRSPKFTDAYGNRAVAYREKGELDKAIADFTKAIELWPTDNLFACRGAAYARKGEHTKAIADCTEAIHRNANNVVAYINRGALYIGVKDPDKAMADFNEVSRLDPELAEAYVNLVAANAERRLRQSHCQITDG